MRSDIRFFFVFLEFWFQMDLVKRKNFFSLMNWANNSFVTKTNLFLFLWREKEWRNVLTEISKHPLSPLKYPKQYINEYEFKRIFHWLLLLIFIVCLTSTIAIRSSLRSGVSWHLRLILNISLEIYGFIHKWNANWLWELVWCQFTNECDNSLMNKLSDIVSCTINGMINTH